MTTFLLRHAHTLRNLFMGIRNVDFNPLLKQASVNDAGHAYLSYEQIRRHLEGKVSRGAIEQETGYTLGPEGVYFLDHITPNGQVAAQDVGIYLTRHLTNPLFVDSGSTRATQTLEEIGCMFGIDFDVGKNRVFAPDFH